MRIIDKEEMLKMPNGTVFMEYIPDMLTGTVRIKTGYYERIGKPLWNGELNIEPSFVHDIDDKNYCYTQWSTVDRAAHDYDEKQLFVVFSKTEILQMISCLQWALTECKTYFNQDMWYHDNELPIHDDDIEDYI